MTDKLSLQEVLDLKYLGTWAWAPGGEHLAYILDDGGRHELWIFDRDSDESHRISEENASCADFAWDPQESKIIYLQDDDLWLAGYENGEWQSTRRSDTDDKVESVSWSPDGQYIAYISDGSIYLEDLDSGFKVSHSPEKAAAIARGEQALLWSDDGSKLAFAFQETEDKSYHLGVLTRNGDLLWRTYDYENIGMVQDWLTNDQLLFAISSDRGTIIDYVVATFPSDAQNQLQETRGEHNIDTPALLEPEISCIHRQEALGTPGGLRLAGAWPSPDGQRILMLSEDDGWGHFYLYDLNSEKMKQVTFGECEDVGHLGHGGIRPDWHPDGRHVCYATNRGESGQRQLYLLDTENETNHQLTTFIGTNVQPQWSPDGETLAFLHCDPQSNMNIWVLQITPKQVKDAEQKKIDETSRHLKKATQTMPDGWREGEKCFEPQEVVFKGAQDWDIHGYLIAPDDVTESEQIPALVWVHGGPIRQMRYGFHPSRSYAIFYAFSQYLAHQGYATLMVNFRGGIGYGREFRNGLYRKMGVDDVRDVVAAGQYLKGLPYVDENRVGVWGLSYGGYMTLAALTKYPDEFAVGINIAGIWDFAQWTHWIHERQGHQGGMFEVNFEGPPEESPELYRIGSPCTYKDNLKKPLINLQGTADANVDFEQMNRIVKDMVKLGVTYEAYYYPGEVHTFRYRRSWADAFPKIEREMDKYLK